jgi:hypothetical protein
MDVVKGDLRINSYPEIDRNQTAMGLPPVTSAVFLIAKSFLAKRGRLGGISEMPLLPLWRSSVSGMYVCIIIDVRLSAYGPS